MDTFRLDTTQSNKFKYLILFNDEFIACFTNKKHALRIIRFLQWYQKKFGDFDDAQSCARQLHQSIKKANLKINFDTINF